MSSSPSFRAGNGIRTRDILLGRQNLQNPFAFAFYLLHIVVSPLSIPTHCGSGEKRGRRSSFGKIVPAFRSAAKSNRRGNDGSGKASRTR